MIEDIDKQIRQGIKPDGMSFKLFDYAEMAVQLDEILDALTKDECAKRCGNSRGCCVANGYQLGATEEMIRYQEQTGNRQKDVSGKCQYHKRERGCTLPSSLKPPKCLATLCIYLRKRLETDYRREEQEFVELMAEAADASDSLVNGDKGETLFSAMEQAIRAGRNLVNKVRAEIK
jgi:hypothetical protein